MEKQWNEEKLEFTEKITRLEGDNEQLQRSIHEQEQSNQSRLQILQNEKTELEQQIQTHQQTINELQTSISQFQGELDQKVCFN